MRNFLKGLAGELFVLYLLVTVSYALLSALKGMDFESRLVAASLAVLAATIAMTRTKTAGSGG